MRSELPQLRKFECSDCEYVDYRLSARKVGEVVPGGCPRCGGNLKVTAEETPDFLVKPLKLVSQKFKILDVVALADRMDLEVSSRNPKGDFRSLLGALKRVGYLPIMRERDDELRLMLIKYPKVKPARSIINIALFVATIITTFIAGYYLFDNSYSNAALFSAALMLMLGSHELGHKVSSWRSGVESTMPYFVPGPPPLGTFGAVINIKSPIPTKEALVEMGAAGPLTGFVLSVVITFVGLSFATANPLEAQLPFIPGMFGLLQMLTLGRASSILNLNPLTFAGWVVMLLTMFNLIPAGQLDGGHIARSILGRQRHFWLTRVLGFSLFGIGLVFPDYPFWVWGFMIVAFFRGYHPGALDDISRLSTSHKVLAAVTLAVFLLCLPLPLP